MICKLLHAPWHRLHSEILLFKTSIPFIYLIWYTSMEFNTDARKYYREKIIFRQDIFPFFHSFTNHFYLGCFLLCFFLVENKTCIDSLLLFNTQRSRVTHQPYLSVLTIFWTITIIQNYNHTHTHTLTYIHAHIHTSTHNVKF